MLAPRKSVLLPWRRTTGHRGEDPALVKHAVCREPGNALTSVLRTKKNISPVVHVTRNEDEDLPDTPQPARTTCTTSVAISFHVSAMRGTLKGA